MSEKCAPNEMPSRGRPGVDAESDNETVVLHGGVGGVWRFRGGVGM
jgi:hypothetical protein